MGKDQEKLIKNLEKSIKKQDIPNLVLIWKNSLTDKNMRQNIIETLKSIADSPNAAEWRNLGKKGDIIYRAFVALVDIYFESEEEWNSLLLHTILNVVPADLINSSFGLRLDFLALPTPESKLLEAVNFLDQLGKSGIEGLIDATSNKIDSVKKAAVAALIKWQNDPVYLEKLKEKHLIMNSTAKMFQNVLDRLE
jgi:hypothetical protein